MRIAGTRIRGWAAAATASAVTAGAFFTAWLSAQNGQLSWPVGFAALFYAGVGAILVVRGRGTTIGWTLLMVAVLWTSTLLGSEYAIHGLRTSPGVLPGAVFAAWLSESTWLPALLLAFTVLPLIFPHGRPFGQGWTLVTWMALGFAAAFLGLTALQGSLSPIEGLVIDNPIGVLPVDDFEDHVFGPAALLALSGPVGAIYRFRRSTDVVRQQLRWFMASSAAGLSLFALAGIVGSSRPSAVVSALTTIGLGLPPLGIWVAVLRYRLYDIDRLISRTVSWGVVTAVLVGGYAALVFVLRELLPVEGELAVVASTLAVAAVFNPLRRGVQAWVDRRFNRSRYDARHTIELFGIQLRFQHELQSLARDLTLAAHETMQPTRVSLWLREPA